MLKPISRLCTRHPWMVILVISAITTMFIHQMMTNLEFDADITKSLPSDVAAVKSDDYYKKNFNYKEVMLIGVERKKGSIMEVDLLRKIESIVLDIKNLKGTKTFQSQLTGREETLVQPLGIDIDNINSVANLEDAVMDKESGSVVTGSVIKKLKMDHGIVSPHGREKRLPESDADLRMIIPDLTKRILQDRSFRNNLLSEDMHAATITVPVHRKWDYKKRYTILELSTALDEGFLKSRFQGKESTFPFHIYGKTIDGIRIDDAYISSHVKTTRQKLSSWLKRELSDATENDYILHELMARELTADSFKKIMIHTEGKDFFTTPTMTTWENFINDLWDFTLAQVDPFSRENLEFQLYNTKTVVNLEEIYHEVGKILKKHSLTGVQYYVAGIPVVVSVLSSMMREDLGTLMPIAILVILVVLGLSFKSFRGVFIPALTVVLSVTWTLGLMALLGIPLTVGTTVMPIILLGIGTAYGIHFLNRYNEDALFYRDRRELVQNSVRHVGVAVVMAALTTIAGFSSLTTTGLSTIQEFGAFSAIGIFFALVLSLTLTPSLLVLFKLPKHGTIRDNSHTVIPSEGMILRTMRSSAEKVVQYPKQVCTLLAVLFIASVILATGNKFESNKMGKFKEHNPIFQSDRFINKNLTGTTSVNLIFKFRDHVNLDNSKSRAEFKTRLAGFAAAWKNMVDEKPELGPAAEIARNIQVDVESLPGSLGRISQHLTLIQDILNEEFVIEIDSAGSPGSENSLSALEDEDSESRGALDDEGSNELGGLAEDMEETSIETTGTFVNLSNEQVAGLKDINKRMGLDDDFWGKTAAMVLQLREAKNSLAGLKMQYRLNLTNDFLAVDIKQPEVLKKLENLHHTLKDAKNPVVRIEGREYSPTGFVMTPVDMVRKFYKVFYHNDDPAFDRLPDVSKDGFTDITLTDRAINGVVLNQALSGNRDRFEGVISRNLKEFQVQTMLRDGSTSTLKDYMKLSMDEVNRLFPSDDPYIESVRIGGSAPTGVAINDMLSQSQIRSVLLSFLFVFVVTFFIFRSAMGGLFSLIPLAMTVVLNFGLIRIISGEINTSTMMVASIAIGTGVDYTIHFLERLKIQLRAGDNLSEAYVQTFMSSGKAILVNASAVALGFLVLIFSVFVTQVQMGILMAATMLSSSVGALVLLPAIILLVRPKYLTRLMTKSAMEQIEIEEVAVNN